MAMFNIQTRSIDPIRFDPGGNSTGNPVSRPGGSIEPVTIDQDSNRTGGSQPAAVKVLYLVSDWQPSRNRVEIGGASRSAAQSIAKAASIGGSVGTAVPLIGTGAGAAIGAAVAGVKRLFSGGSKPDRLIEHIEDFYRELYAETFGSNSFNLGVGLGDGNGRNAPVTKNQFPESEMREFLLQSGLKFLEAIEQAPNANSGDRESIRQIRDSLRFTSRPPGRGQAAIYAAFKVDPSVVAVDSSGNPVQTTAAESNTQARRDNKKVAGGTLAAIIALFFLR